VPTIPAVPRHGIQGGVGKILGVADMYRIQRMPSLPAASRWADIRLKRTRKTRSSPAPYFPSVGIDVLPQKGYFPNPRVLESGLFSPECPRANGILPGPDIGRCK
jgi:hypothetical protein